MNDLIELKKRISDFAEARDWDQFHSPKNLVMSLSIEVGELMEHFQWLTEEQSRSLDESVVNEVADEIADVQVYLVRLADKLGVDILDAVFRKMEKNEKKYPADRVRGSALKYTEYEK